MKKILFDNVNQKDTVDIISKGLKTSIDIRCHETGEIIFKGLENKVIIPGSGLIARKLFDISSEEITPTYNNILGITTPTGEETHTIDTRTNATADNQKVLLFCIGTDGCGSESSQVYPVDYTKWIPPESIIPFRYPVASSDISDSLRQVYFGRKEIGDYIAYYFKRFDTDPVFVQQYVDGTPVDSSVYDSEKTDSAETYVELVLSITKDDIRDYFIATTGIDSARVNTISLCYSWPTEIDGKLYFNDIRPLTKLNIPNEPMIDLTKGIDIIYHVYM